MERAVRFRLKSLVAVLTLALVAFGGCEPSDKTPKAPAGTPSAAPDAQSGPEKQPLPAESPAQPEATAPPALTVVLTGPGRAAVGGAVTYGIKLANRGETTATDLVLQCLASENLWPIDGESALRRDIARLGPGESKSMGVELLVTGPGPAEVHVELLDSRGAIVAGVGQIWTATDEPPAAQTAQVAQAEPPKEPPVDLGPPLVEDASKLARLDPVRSVWIDKAGKRVVLLGQVCQRQAMLEMFACPKGTKEHESIVAVDAKAAMIHAGLLAIGATPGHTVSFDPQYTPATGERIDVIVSWKDAQGKVQSAKAQDWVRQVRTKEAMTDPWVFAGSGFWKDEATGTEYYMADSGDFICVSNFPSAMLDLPVPSSDQADSLLFEAFTERIPPLGTPVTVVLVATGEKPKDPPPPETTPKEIESVDTASEVKEAMPSGAAEPPNQEAKDEPSDKAEDEK